MGQGMPWELVQQAAGEERAYDLCQFADNRFPLSHSYRPHLCNIVAWADIYNNGISSSPVRHVNGYCISAESGTDCLKHRAHRYLHWVTYLGSHEGRSRVHGHIIGI